MSSFVRSVAARDCRRGFRAYGAPVVCDRNLLDGRRALRLHMNPFSFSFMFSAFRARRQIFTAYSLRVARGRS